MGPVDVMVDVGQQGGAMANTSHMVSILCECLLPTSVKQVSSPYGEGISSQTLGGVGVVGGYRGLCSGGSPRGGVWGGG